MDITTFIILSLSAWRVSNMFVAEKGPFNLFLNIRKRIGIQHLDDGEPFAYPETFLAQLLSCTWCTSVWVGAAWAVAWFLWPMVTLKVAVIFALSAGAILIDNHLKGYHEQKREID